MTREPAVHAVEDGLASGATGAAGLQHVLVMYGAAIAAPLIVGGALKLPKEQVALLVNAAVFASGVATLIQAAGLWRFGIRLPAVMGPSFAAVGPMVALAASGTSIAGLLGASIAAGVLAVAAAPFAGRLVRWFPPLVTGTIVTVIGITLLRAGINWAGGGLSARDFGDPANLGVVALVLVAILAATRLFEGFVARIGVLIGLVIGFAAALAFGMVDFAGVRDAAWVAAPYPLRFGVPRFEPGAILTLCVIMIVVIVESTGLFLALGETCRKALGASDIARGIAACGLGTVLAGALNAFPQTVLAQNVGLVGVSGLRSRWAAAAAGAMLVALGLLPKLGALAACVPPPVLGGAALVLFGMVAAIGIRILARVDYAPRHNLLIIAVSIALGMIPMVAPTFFAQAPRWTGPIFNSGITLAALSAVLLNALFNGASETRGAEARIGATEAADR